MLAVETALEVVEDLGAPATAGQRQELDDGTAALHAGSTHTSGVGRDKKIAACIHKEAGGLRPIIFACEGVDDSLGHYPVGIWSELVNQAAVNVAGRRATSIEGAIDGSVRSNDERLGVFTIGAALDIEQNLFCIAGEG